MNERSRRISRLLSSQAARVSYIRAKLSVLIPAQIRSLRVSSVEPPMPHQRDLARESELHQSRISMFETPGASNMTIETLAKIAAGLRVALVIKFVPFSDMVRWEDSFSPETFHVTRLTEDDSFLNPQSETQTERSRQLGGLAEPPSNEAGTFGSGKSPGYESLKNFYRENAIGA